MHNFNNILRLLKSEKKRQQKQNVNHWKCFGCFKVVSLQNTRLITIKSNMNFIFFPFLSKTQKKDFWLRRVLETNSEKLSDAIVSKKKLFTCTKLNSNAKKRWFLPIFYEKLCENRCFCMNFAFFLLELHFFPIFAKSTKSAQILENLHLWRICGFLKIFLDFWDINWDFWKKKSWIFEKLIWTFQKKIWTFEMMFAESVTNFGMKNLDFWEKFDLLRKN